MLIGDHKVCGILVERVNTRPPMVVIGIGINVDQTADELPVPTATSLALAGHPVDRTTLFGDVVQSLRAWLGLFAGSPNTFMNQYRGRSATLDRDVRVALPGDRVVEGRVSTSTSTAGWCSRRATGRSRSAREMSCTCAPRSDRLSPWPSTPSS